MRINEGWKEQDAVHLQVGGSLPAGGRIKQLVLRIMK